MAGWRRGAAALGLAVWLAVGAVRAEPAAEPAPATLVADSLSIEADSRLIAEGGVEVFYNGIRLTATRVVYDQKTDRLTITGPIRIEDGNGDVVLADEAEMSADLREGILRSARVVLGDQLQIAASEVSRIGGRYSQMGRSVASACRLCAGETVPLWEIRASSIVQDDEKQRLYFRDASLHVLGVPVAFIPRLRIPSPGVERATGFLVPSLVTSTTLGTGVKLPYFVAIAPDRDLTLTPFVTNQNGRTLNFRYRQALSFGPLEIDLALTEDEILPGRTRGYGQAIGEFGLPRGFTLAFDVSRVSDPGYLLDYDISDADRLASVVSVTRVTRDDIVNANTVSYQTLRESEDNSTLPTPITHVSWAGRFDMPGLGGQGGFEVQVYGAERASSLPNDTDADGIADGRDTQRGSVQFTWQRDWISQAGLISTAQAEITGDVYNIAQDGPYTGQFGRLFPVGAVALRWPLTRATAGGATQVLEPMAQLVVAPEDGGRVPNEDSTLVEFDETNLLSLDRFPGWDAVETGPRLNIGLGFTHLAPSGWVVAATAGRVLRTQADDQFSIASGLTGTQSDWLGMFQIARPGLAFTNRVLLADDASVTKAESRLDAASDAGSVAASYFWAVADAAEDRDIPSHEIFLDAAYQVTPAWNATVLGRYDLEAEAPIRAGLGLQYRNECIAVDLSLSRRYTSSQNAEPSTDFGITVDLLGLGGGKAGPPRTCWR